MEINKIYNEDCLEGFKKIESEKINLFILDPPYFKTINEKWDFKWRTEKDYLNWCEEWIKEISRISKKNSSLYLFGYFRILHKIIPILEKYGFEFRQQIIIDKGIKSICGRKTSTYKMFPTTTEHILFFIKDSKPFIKQFLKKQQQKEKLSSKEINEKLGMKSNGGGVWSLYTGNNILAQVPTKELWEKLQKVLNFKLSYKKIAQNWNIQMGFTDVWKDIDFYKEKRQHPTQKPFKLIERLILASSNKNDLILDPFMGSGTTAFVCNKLNRNFIGFEIDKEYYKKSILKLNK